MILINMMMAIINMAFEEIKQNKEQYKSKFELMAYIKRTCREMVGVRVAKPVHPVFADEVEDDTETKEDQEERDKTEKTSQNFSEKTDQLLTFIEQNYLDGMSSKDSSKLLSKLKSQSNGDAIEEKKVMEKGFDAIFSADK